MDKDNKWLDDKSKQLADDMICSLGQISVKDKSTFARNLDALIAQAVVEPRPPIHHFEAIFDRKKLL